MCHSWRTPVSSVIDIFPKLGLAQVWQGPCHLRCISCPLVRACTHYIHQCTWQLSATVLSLCSGKPHINDPLTGSVLLWIIYKKNTMMGKTKLWLLISTTRCHCNFTNALLSGSNALMPLSHVNTVQSVKTWKVYMRHPSASEVS